MDAFPALPIRLPAVLTLFLIFSCFIAGFNLP